jgi:hypothetical protein
MIPSQAPFRREELLQPDVILSPVFWVCSDVANDVTDVASSASGGTPQSRRGGVEEAGAPIGWKDLAVLPVRPPSRCSFYRMDIRDVR